ncbi:MAG: helix-turn-helix domain-containing protein [Lachnospiraceae bacterium]|nr:helix-turn-helix domain-containing protein [Lachnospiraceae bacterium]
MKLRGCSYEEAYRLLTDALLERHSLQQIVDLACELFENPLFVMNTGFHLIARSEGDLDDVIWQDLLKNGFYSYDNLKVAKRDRRFATIADSRRVVYFSVNDDNPSMQNLSRDSYTTLKIRNSVLKKNRLTFNVFNGPQKLAALSVIEDKTPFTPADVDLILLLQRVLRIYFLEAYPSDRPERLLDRPIETLFVELLDNPLYNREILEERLRFFGFDPKPHFCLLAVRFRTQPNLPDAFRPYKTALAPHFPDAVPMIYRDCLLFLFNYEHSVLFAGSSFDRIESLLKENNLIGGLSRPFDHLTDLRQGYEEAVRALSLGSGLLTGTSLFPYAQCGILDIVDTVVRSHPNPASLCHLLVGTIRAYDKKHHTSYERTLRSYLNHTDNLQAAAAELGIRRNSLSYRIGQIEHLFDVSLSNVATIHYLYISYYIDDYIRSRSREED